jgi:CelD/BcsL family acetyltransferase involved in cellulose biosynthesis
MRPSAPAGRATPLRVVALPSAERSAAGAAWRAAERHSSHELLPFCGWDWTQRWLGRFGDIVPHEFVIAERDGVPRAAALLTRSTRRRGPITVRRMHVGTAGEPDDCGVFVEYNGLCVAPVERGEFATALLDHIHRSRGWDELHLDGFASEHAAALLAAEPRMVSRHRSSPVLDLDGPADLVDALGSRSARAAVRRSLRGLQPYSTVWAQDVDVALRLLDDLARLHQQRWQDKGEPGAFASQRFRDFHRDMVAEWLPAGRAVLFAVRHHDEVVAAVYGFVVGDTLQYYQGGFRMFENGKVRAGYAAHMLIATAARDRGLKHYEYLVGDSRFKSDLSTGQRTLTWAHLTRRRPRAMAVEVARRIRARSAGPR